MKARNTGIPAIGALAFVLAACATPAGTQTAQLDDPTTGPNGEAVVCRSIAVTGTRFPQKTCKTEAAWAEFDAITNGNAKEQTDKFQRINTGCSTQAQGGCS